MPQPTLDQDPGSSQAYYSHTASRVCLAGLCFIFGILGPALRAPRTAHLGMPQTAYEAPQDRALELRPILPLREKDIRHLAEDLRARTGLPVVLGAPVAAPVQTRLPTGSLHADKTLDWLFYGRPPDAWGVMAVTSADLHSADGGWVYGLANLRDRVSVISLRRFQHELASTNPARRSLAQQQLSRAAFHEVGHMLGMEHCDTKGCLMSAIAHRDEIGPQTAPCHTCVSRFQRQLQQPPHKVMDLLYHGDGYFHRGHVTKAMSKYRQAQDSLESAPPWIQAETYNRIGAALLSTERVAAGEAYVDRALALSPQLGPALFNKALIAGYAGREAEALQALEQWRVQTPDRLQRSEMAARFYLDVVEDSGSALLELRAYRDAGGDKVLLLEALERLDEPGFVVFTSKEVDVF